MQLQLLRNAALKLVYAGRTLLIDPDLAPKHARESFTGRSPNPMVGLPSGVEAILDGVELVIVSHLHEDHFDDVAKASLPKRLPLICQPGDEEAIRAAGFTDVRPLVASLDWNGIGLTRREGSHGLGPVLELMGSVMGFSLKAAGEPSLYWAGDSVFIPLSPRRSAAPRRTSSSPIHAVRAGTAISSSWTKGRRWRSAKPCPTASSSPFTWRRSTTPRCRAARCVAPPRYAAYRRRACSSPPTARFCRSAQDRRMKKGRAISRGPLLRAVLQFERQRTRLRSEAGWKAMRAW